MTGWRSTRARVFGALALVAFILVGSLALRNASATAQASPSPSSSGVATGTTGPTVGATPRPSGPAPSPDAQVPTSWGTTEVAATLSDIAITSRGYLVVGDDRRGGVVWTSTNGRDWQVDDDSVIFDRVHLEAIASNSHLTAIVGCDRPESQCTGPAAWIWNGTWHRVDGNPFGATTLVDVVTTNGAIVILGTASNGSHRLWSSTDGATWSAVAAPGATGDTIAAIAADGDRLLAVGRSKDLSATAWVSTDLRTWIGHLIEAKATALAATGFHGSFVVGGGHVLEEANTDQPITAEPAVWTSTDGATWRSAGLENDNNGAITLVGATSRGYMAVRADCCSGYLIPPAGRATAFQDGPMNSRAIVEGPQGYIALGGGGFLTFPEVAMNVPLEPAKGPVGEGWNELPTTLPIPSPLTAASDAAGVAYVFSETGAPGTLRVDRFDGTKWLRLPDLAGGIRGAKAVMGTKGLIYLVGVTTDASHGRTIEYNPKTRTWRLRAAMPTPRTGFGLAAPSNGSIYAFGGRVSPCCDGVAGDGGLAVVERFDPASNSWHAVRSMPVAEVAPGAVAASAQVTPGEEQVFPSQPGNGPIVYVFLPARVWAYDPARDTWTAGPAGLSYGVTGSPVVGVDGIVRVFTCERYDLYDPFNNHWQAGQFFPSPRCGVVPARGADAAVYVFGGDYLPSPGRSVLAFFAGGG